MKISSITINNFKGIKDMTITPQHLNVYLGPNGAGKTSILKAITFALTGNIKAGYIKNGAKSTKVILVFEDGSTIERTRGVTGTAVRCNGSKTTSKSTNEFIESKLGASSETYNALCGVDYFSALTQKDLSALFLSILPARISHDFLLKTAGEIVDRDSHRNLSEEEKAYLKELFAKFDDAFDLDDIAEAYDTVFERRKGLKVLVKSLTAKAEFDQSTLPKEKKEELEKKLYAIAKKETEAASYQKDMTAYERSVKARKDASERLEVLKKTLEVYGDLQKPNPETQKTLEENKVKFEQAIDKHRNTLATLRSNLSMIDRTLESLDKPVCPISDHLICTSDKSGLKAELTELAKKNQVAIEEHEAFVKKCEAEIEKINKNIKESNSLMIAYTKKEGVEKQIRDFVLPEVLVKPKAIQVSDFSKEKVEINQKLRILTAFEQTQKAEKELKEKQEGLKLAEFAVRVLDVKTGVPQAVLKAAMKKFEEMCNKKAQVIRNNFNLKFMCEDGIEVLVETEKDAGFIPMEMASTGEFVIIAYLLMYVINSITQARYLVIDNMDKLDANYTRAFIDILDKDNSYEHIFVGAVDHTDTKELLKGVNVTAM